MATYSFDLNDDLAEMLGGVSRRYGISREEAVRRALSLLRLADQEHQQGERCLGIVSLDPATGECRDVQPVVVFK